MRLGTIRLDGNVTDTRAVRVEGGELVVLDFSDVGQLLAAEALEDVATLDGQRVPMAEADWAPLITEPGKIICVGVNYRDHAIEMGSELPKYPTCFSKFTEALIGANDDLHLPHPDVSVRNDWEAELCVVMGSHARHVTKEEAVDHVAGYTVFNDFSVRDWQKRTSQFLLGKTFEHASALGPVMTTADELGDGSGLAIRSAVNGVVKQESNTDQLVFGVAELISVISTAVTLAPGDLIATGTPGGVGAGRDPQEWLVDDDTLTITIEGIGEIENRCVVANL